MKIINMVDGPCNSHSEANKKKAKEKLASENNSTAKSQTPALQASGPSTSTPSSHIVLCACSSLDENGLMVECEVCLSWLHCDYNSLSSSVVYRYVCPFCVHNVCQRVTEICLNLTSSQAKFSSLEMLLNSQVLPPIL